MMTHGGGGVEIGGEKTVHERWGSGRATLFKRRTEITCFELIAAAAPKVDVTQAMFFGFQDATT